MLVQLVQESFVNPQQTPTVRRLLQRGLIDRDPVLRPMNRSFALFVDQIQEPMEVARWERSVTGGRWKHTRWMLLGLVPVILLFVWSTQRAAFDTGIAFLSAAAIGIPGLLKLATSFSRANPRGGE